MLLRDPKTAAYLINVGANEKIQCQRIALARYLGSRRACNQLAVTLSHSHTRPGTRIGHAKEQGARNRSRTFKEATSTHVPLDVPAAGGASRTATMIARRGAQLRTAASSSTLP